MKISIIVKKYVTKDGKRTFMGAKARGQYLVGILGVNPEVNYLVKFINHNPVALPTEEGIYDVDLGNSQAWVDTRVDYAQNPTVRIAPGLADNVIFEKKADLKPFAETTPAE